ncbi:MAG: glycosyltransferase family 4 protein [Solirubrobacterales bacterium]
MRVQVVDPPAYTPPYDRALCAALARAGVAVELITSPFLFGSVPAPDGYRVEELFYRNAGRAGTGGSGGARVAKLAGHLPGMVRLRARARDADLVHFQWLTLPSIDAALLPHRPRVLTVHDPPPASGLANSGWRAAAGRMDALVSHSEAGADRVASALRVDRERIRVIRHGAFDYLTRIADRRPLPDDLAAAEGPIALCFGLIRPYKGIDVLLEAFRDIAGAELWIVGRAMMDLGPLRELADRCRSTVRFVPRFITDPEIPALFERADLVVLPYRQADQSGVLYTALAFGKPIVATRVGGFADLADFDAVRLVEPGDASELTAAITGLLGHDAARRELAAAAARAAAGPYSWDVAARETVALYRELLG